MNTALTFLYIYLTDRCNLKCFHCWQSAPLEGKGKYSRLNFEECRHFLEDAKAMGLKNITFSGGEPLLNPEFHKFAEFFHDNSIGMALETNGILIPDSDILNTIKNCRIYCAVSVDGFEPGTHNKQRGRKDAHRLTMEGINLLEQSNLSYQLIMAISKFNYHELVPLLEWVKENCKYCTAFKINVVNTLGRAKGMRKKGLLFEAAELPKVCEEIAGLADRFPIIKLHVDPVFFSFKNLMKKISCGGFCGYTSSLSILANGNVSICSLGKQVDRYIFGHVSQIDVKNVWENNPFLKEVHEDVHLRLKGICSNCIFRKECAGSCRAEALTAYGDFFAPASRCQEYYESGNFPGSKLIDPTLSMEYKNVC
jgi:SynChlorMet cassette radical SAM/SPASM protein ScmF